MNEEISQIVDKLTLEEKASLCSGDSWMSTEAIDRLDVPSINVSDGPHGVRIAEKSKVKKENKITTCFPTASAIASSWNRNLVREVGKALGRECRNLGVHVLLAPGINIKRTPLCGRNFEYYSEDPYLSGELGAAFVNGVQSQGVGTSLKHFACNNQETDRMLVSAEVEERPLREIYLAGFKRVVKGERPWTVMCSYNKLNGTYTSEHPYLLTEVLRDEWDFEGLVVSDWGAVNDRLKGLEAGLDLEMPGPSEANDRKIIEAVRSGRIEESVLDRAVERILRLVFKATNCAQEELEGGVDAQAHHELAKKVASESIVLLKNQNGLLPLDENNLSSLAVVGRMAKEPSLEGGGSSEVELSKVDTPLEEIKKTVDDKIQVSYAPGYPKSDRVDEEMAEEALETGKEADVVVLFAGLPRGIESEGYDRENMKLPEIQLELIQKISEVQSNTVVVLNNGSPVSTNAWIGNVPALLEGWLLGQAGGGAIADILFGKVNPSGKLAETFPVSLEDNPSHINFPGENGKVLYGEGLFVGYRYYDEKNIEPQFPFGYGLSYTSFDYSELNLDQKEMDDQEDLTVTVTVKNTGDLAGKETVQLYVGHEDPKLTRPPKELKSFKKVALKPGESKTVEFTLRGRDFSYYDPSREEWVVETGVYDILVGSSSRDIRAKSTFRLKSTRDFEKTLTKDNSLKEWLENEEARKLLKQIFPEGEGDRPEGTSEWMKNLPLKKLTSLSQGKITEEMIEELIESVQN
ncbi:glycosyl hydrolase family 3 [candidate division MSBL1 archaeon SCGC-AAA259O05]|uniref:Glycosyl hydrolase family 3 n=1 Tax=candidate division MSBL1 archaeon SCGC-AAA259O05 TaxID=1698271 RepID=A0A133UZS0_9EURY|nr:glycosyl hydrolase family 3 [candidate division MSBL1 archaeon SCGC-AAA259O05]